MKNIVGFVFALLFLVTAGCGTAPLENQSASSTEANGESKTEEIQLTTYRPETGDSKVFTSNGQTLFTEEIIDQNNQYVQRMITLGSMETMQVLKWSDEDVTVVYEDENPGGDRESILAEFESVEEVDKLVEQPSSQSSDLEISKVDSLEVPYGSFEDILMVSDVAGEEGVIITTYYAKSVGLIKQVYETTGENSQKEIAELSSIK
ncbi:hypothetical protein [Pseudalkalibacillus hwajinpoensis]|uniref:DUF4367 domain-containing protein n=1 Tax=Guptibacillus hwajinpoensis TaxID=208199 RepID=A0A4U1MI17_9BACL|nr:hypothetical protein [Pseudalkalibacillus hwajinpoensis]TKD70969.1 hypothetical protein FBF83_10220 [Pseudalkalibacillus hwajinpoensis]